MIYLPNIIDIDLTGKRVLIREDFNVPTVDDRIVNTKRIQAAVPTIEYALSQGAAVILISHKGRPTRNEHNTLFSLEPVVPYLSRYINQNIRFEKNWLEGFNILPGEVVLCENVRFQKGEISNDIELAQKIAALGDVFAIDAFSVAHRCEASTTGAIRYANQACCGLSLLSELENLTPLDHPERPFIGIIGGAKANTKIAAFEGLLKRVDHLLLGGDIANVFLKAKKIMNNTYDISKQDEMLLNIIRLIENYSFKTHLPTDGIVTHQNTREETCSAKAITSMDTDDEIQDIGPVTVNNYIQLLNQANTIFWNGPMGVFENLNCQKGTQLIGKAIAQSEAFSVAGGGETLAAIDKWQLYPTCISTGGGALLDYLAGKNLPVLEAFTNQQISSL